MIGSTVDVRELEVHSELNCEKGAVESIATDVGRYGVKLTRGELVAVKIENLDSPESCNVRGTLDCENRCSTKGGRDQRGIGVCHP